MFDLIIVGSGPAGLYAGYLAKMHNLKFKLIEASKEVGGQMVLFKDKPVYDMPGQNNVDGKEVLSSLLEQFKKTNEKIFLNERLIDITGQHPKFIVKTSRNTFQSKCIIIATGGGVFEPIKLGLKNEDNFENIRYSVENIDNYKNKKLVVFGGGDSAIDWSHFFKDICKEVILVHRREQFRAQEYLLEQLKKSIKILTPYKIKEIINDNKFTKVQLINIKTKQITNVKCDEILVFFGQKKIINKEDSYGINMKKTSFIVKSNMETSREGIFAIGNVASYEGKISVLATALGEAATAIGSVVSKVYPGKKMTYVKKKEN